MRLCVKSQVPLTRLSTHTLSHRERVPTCTFAEVHRVLIVLDSKLAAAKHVMCMYRCKFKEGLEVQDCHTLMKSNRTLPSSLLTASVHRKAQVEGKQVRSGLAGVGTLIGDFTHSARGRAAAPTPREARGWQAADSSELRGVFNEQVLAERVRCRQYSGHAATSICQDRVQVGQARALTLTYRAVCH